MSRPQATRKAGFFRRLWRDEKTIIGMIVVWIILQIVVYLKYN